VREQLTRVYAAVDDVLHRAVLGSVRWPVPRWPLYTFMAGAMFCLLVSAVAHLFGCCSEHVAATIWRFDYAGEGSWVGVEILGLEGSRGKRGLMAHLLAHSPLAITRS